MEAAESGIMEELFWHHVDNGENQRPAESAPAQRQSGEKRKLEGGRRAKPRKEKKTASGLAMPDSWRADDGADPAEEVPATQPLCEFLEQVVHDDTSAQGYWQDIIDEVTSETLKVRAQGLLGSVQLNLIKTALARMHGLVQEMVQAGRWDEAKAGSKSEAEMCLSIVRAALGFLSEETVGPNIFNDELFETCVQFIDGFINHVIVPAVQQAIKDRMALESESATGKRRKSREHSKGVGGGLKSKVDAISHVINVLGDVLRLKVKVQDPQCIAVSRICLATFFLDFPAAVYHIQQACVGLMQTLFAKYPDHREHIIQEIGVRAVSWQPAPKDFCFQLKAPKLGQVQMISALIMSMLQSCCDGSLSKLGQHTTTAVGSEDVHPALMLMILLIESVQRGMHVKKIDKGGGETGYKLLFQHLVADVCWVVGAPEWPIATMLLKALWKYTYTMCTKSSFPHQYRLDAAKLLGDIVVRIKQLLLAAASPNIGKIGDVPSGAGSLKDTAVLQSLRRQQMDVLSRSGSQQQSPIDFILGTDLSDPANQKLAHKLVAQQLLLNYLVARSVKDQTVRHAKQNWIFLWASDKDAMVPPATKQCYEWFWNDANYLAHKKIDGELDLAAPDAANYAAYLCASHTQANLSLAMTDILKPLLVLLKHPKMPQFRQRALKALSQVIELDPQVLGDDVVRDAVCGSMVDPAKSVRAEAVSLVGKFMCTSQQLTMQYYESICMRCRDSGSSVRKAAMGILRNLLARCDDKRVMDRACVALIPLLKDESEDICKRTFAFLREIWFPATVSEKDATAPVLGVAARFAQMRTVVDAAHKANMLVGRDACTITDILEDFMKETIKSKPESVCECEQYCREALQAIIRSQEVARPRAAAAGGSKFQVGDKVEGQRHNGMWCGATIVAALGAGYRIKWDDGPQDDVALEEGKVRELHPDPALLSLFRTLALLARVRPELIVKDVELLCKFLSSQERAGGSWSKGQCEMIGTVAAIYDCVLPFVQDPPDLLIKYLQQDLPMLIQYAPTMPLITISVKCLCTLVKSVGASRRRAPAMYTALQKCFRFQINRLKDPQFAAKPRCLIIAGLFCRFSDFKLHLDKGKVAAIQDASVKDLFELTIKHYIASDALPFKRAGFACLGSLFVRSARLVQSAEAQRVLTGALDHSNEDIRSLAITALTDFVGEDVSDTDTTSLRNSVMQKFLDRILKCMYSEKEEAVAGALRLISTIHDRGQVHPQLCIPDMIAVQQRGVSCAGVGFQVLKLINEKYPDYYSPEVFVQGVMRGFEHQKPGAPLAAEQFVRAFELRLPNKKYVMECIKAIVERVKKGPEMAGKQAGKSPSAPHRPAAGGGGGGGSSSSSGGGGGSSSSGGRIQAMMEDVDRKCFLLSVASVLPLPDQECAQSFISQASGGGLKAGSEVQMHLKAAMEERAAFGKSTVDPKVFDYMYDAARACLLLDLKRFLLLSYHNKSDKADFPVEITQPLVPENVLRCPSGRDVLEHVYNKLKEALRLAASDKDLPSGGEAGSARKRGRPAKKDLTAAARPPGGKDAKKRVEYALDDDEDLDEYDEGDSDFSLYEDYDMEDDEPDDFLDEV